MKLTLIILGIVLTVMIGGAFLVGPKLQGMLGTSSTTTSDKLEGIPVRMETARKATLIETVKAPGEIEPHTKVDISAEVSARIEQLPFEEGDRVKKGDMIVKLDDRNLRAALNSAQARRDGEQFRLQSEQARLAGLITNHTFAVRELERKQSLYASGDTSRSELDAAEESVANYAANVDATKYSISVIESSLAGAKADIDRAADSVAKTVISAPIDGVITMLNAEIGEVVVLGTMNNAGTVIMTIADLSRMLLIAQISEHDIAEVKAGQAATVHTIAYGEEEWKGVVTRVALQRSGAADGTGFYKTEIEIDLRDKEILSGASANVDIHVHEHDGVIVPYQAVVERLIDDLPVEIRKDNPIIDMRKRVVNVVYRVIDGKAICTPVKPGPSDDFYRLIVAGLDPDDLIITGPYKVLDGEGSIKHNDAVHDELATLEDDEEEPSETDNESTETEVAQKETSNQSE